MEKFKLRATLDELAPIFNISNEKKEAIYEKYKDKPDIDVIRDLSVIAYRTLRNHPHYDYVLIRIRNINPNLCPFLDEMKEILKNMFENKMEGNMNLEENHATIKKEIVRFTKLLNEAGIDYYIVGALPCFLKTSIPLFRYHDDIDIMVNEEDIEKLKKVISQTEYIFHDDRYPSKQRFYEMLENKPPHTVMAQNPNNEFHLGFFTFRREKDESMTVTEYSHIIENDSVVVNILERGYTPLGTSLRYDEDEFEYEGTRFRTSTIESVYKLKKFTQRPKDITDMEKIEQFIDIEKLEQLNQNASFEKKLSL